AAEPEPESEAVQHRRALDAAAAAHEAAIATVAERHAAVQTINEQREKELARLAELDALDEISMEQLHAQVNAQKRVRKLDAQLTAALEAVTAAGEEQDEKERQLRRAKVIVGDIRLQEMDTAYIEFVHAFA